MDTIVLKDGIYKASKNKKYKPNGIDIFDSRSNYTGFKGGVFRYVLNEITLEWFSNFGYGSYHFGMVYVNYKGIFITSHDKIETAKEMADLLNDYSEFDEAKKEEILLELANTLALFRDLSESNSWNGANFLFPKEGNMKLNVNKYAFNAFEEMKKKLKRLSKK